MKGKILMTETRAPMNEVRAVTRRSRTSLIAMILGIAVSLFQFSTLGSLGSTAATDAEKAGMAIGAAIVMPSVVTLVIAVILNIIGYFTRNRTVTLISAIFYSISIVLFPLWGFVAIPSMILQFVAFARMKRV